LRASGFATFFPKLLAAFLPVSEGAKSIGCSTEPQGQYRDFAETLFNASLLEAVELTATTKMSIVGAFVSIKPLRGPASPHLILVLLAPAKPWPTFPRRVVST
jgi:hypothetical protein